MRPTLPEAPALTSEFHVDTATSYEFSSEAEMMVEDRPRELSSVRRYPSTEAWVLMSKWQPS